MRFGILGATDVRSADGSAVPVGGPRVRSLLALLLLNAGRLVTTERLIDGLYGDEPPAGAANALQSQVSRLRRGLMDAGDSVEFHPAGYRLAVDPDDVDVHRFERLTRDGRQALAAGDASRAAALLREALGLWRGPALADVPGAPFAEAQVARLEELRVSAVEDRAEAELKLGGHRDLVPELRDLVAAHPLRERARGQLMRALYAGGRQAEALTVFEDARRTLAEELGADPSPELAEVHLAVLRAEPSTAETPYAAPAGPVGLPAQLTSFVGREEELQRIGKLLAAGRLVTLLGPGGAGKTRLAIEAAGQERGEVCFVDLAPVGGASAPDATPVAQAVIESLGLRESGLFAPGPEVPDPGGRLVAALSERRVLLILDNCEHVIEEAARLTHRLLGACPLLRVLATSREALGITGESLCPLPPLALPPPATDALDALGYPAVRLFADRATAVRPGLDPAAELPAIQRICAALDGLPLAIELAAARLRSLSVEEVAARLDDRFRLLSRGDRTKAPRHRTLRAVVEWSWGLLRDDERTLARWLTVFAGGATLEAATRVCGLPDVDELLADLVDKSLVEDAGGRYRMLDTIRVFCAERLAEAGEEESAHSAHAAYFLGLAETAEPYLRRPEQVDWLARLGADHGNLMAALRWTVHADRPSALRLLAAMSSYWWLRGLRSEGAPIALELLDLIGPEPPAGLEEEYVLAIMIAVHGGSQGPRTRDHQRTVASILSNLGPEHPPLRPMVSVLWALSTGPGDADVELQERLMGQDPWSRALRHLGWGYVRMYGGDVAGAEAEFAAGIEGFRAIGDRWGLAGLLTSQARLAAGRGEDELSLALADEAFGLVRQLGALEDMADLLCLRAEGMIHSGDFAQARACYERAGEFARRSGAPETVALVHHGLGELARLGGDLAAARRCHESALSVCTTESFGVREMQARVLVGLGRVAEAEGDAAGAGSRYREALAVNEGDLRAAASAAEGLAGVALFDDDGERAALLLGAGLALRGMSVARDPDVARTSRRARELLGDAAYASAHDRGAALSHEEIRALIDAAAPGR